jgi:ABC-2 type transport system ATP-binding protein
MINELSAQGVTVLVSTHYMDEAERCHHIAYIAWGKLLLEGTIDQVVGQSGLITWAVTGPDLTKLQATLRQQPAVEMAAAFGNDLHVTGSDEKALEAAIAPHRADGRYHWRRAEPSLEDVFIHTLATLNGGNR